MATKKSKTTKKATAKKPTAKKKAATKSKKAAAKPAKKTKVATKKSTAKKKPVAKKAKSTTKKKTTAKKAAPKKKAAAKKAPAKKSTAKKATTKKATAKKPARKKRVKTKYTKAELKSFQELIETKLASAYDELKYYQSEITKSSENLTEGKFMSMEDGAGTFEKEHLNQMASRQKKFIQHLENALIRIKNQTYGVCRETGKLISKERLLAVPHATLSIEAKLAN